MKSFNKLEEIYLINVAIHLPSYNQLYHFLQINKKCKRVLHRLKRTPYFRGSESFNSFLDRFIPETIDSLGTPRKISTPEKECKIIRNPSFIFDKSNVSEIKEIVSLFPKIDTICLYANHEFSDLLIEYSQSFVKLKHISGDLNKIIEFFKNYTENGKEMFVPLPERIVINTLNEKGLVLNEEIVKKIEELLSFIRPNDCCQINAYFLAQPRESDYLIELCQRLRRINCYHYYSIEKGSSRFSENIISSPGIMMIGDGIGSNERNTLINKCHATRLNCGYHTDGKIIPITTSSLWELPEQVIDLKLCNFGGKEYFDQLEANELNRMRNNQKQKVQKDEIQTCFNSFPITMELVTKLSLYKCHSIVIHDGLYNLKELSIQSCDQISIFNQLYLHNEIIENNSSKKYSDVTKRINCSPHVDYDLKDFLSKLETL